MALLQVSNHVQHPRVVASAHKAKRGLTYSSLHGPAINSEGMTTPSTIRFVTGNNKKLMEVRNSLEAPSILGDPHVPTCWGDTEVFSALPGQRSCLQVCVQVVQILEAGHKLPFTVEALKLDLPELQVGLGAGGCSSGRVHVSCCSSCAYVNW